MKKKVVGLVMLLSVVLNSYGVISVDWAGSGGWFFNSTGLGILDPAGSGKQTIAQLIYSPDAIASGALVGGLTSGGEIIWSTYTVTEGLSSTYGDFSGPSYSSGSFTAGYVYARIFQDNNIQANDWYYYSTPMALANLNLGDPAQDIQMSTDLINGNAIDVGSNTAQVVPEPATFLLFGIGGMGAWLIRRNKMQVKEEAEG